MADEQRFEFESLQDVETIRAFLESLIEGFEKGRITLSSEDKEIELNPNTLLKFNVKARKKPNARNQLNIKISWKEPKDDQTGSQKTIRINT
jgi:amphi-Trp domain-containing protein